MTKYAIYEKLNSTGFFKMDKMEDDEARGLIRNTITRLLGEGQLITGEGRKMEETWVGLPGMKLPR